MELGGENEVGEYGEEALMKWEIQRKWRRRACCNLRNATQRNMNKLRILHILRRLQICNLRNIRNMRNICKIVHLARGHSPAHALLVHTTWRV